MEKYLVEKHYPHLDGLRGIAIILVLLIHFYSIQLGWIGVDLFFILSGFLITKILIEYESSFYSYKVFMIRRGLRIFPLYFLALLLIFVLGKDVFIEFIPDFQILSNNQAYFWTYTQNFFLASDIAKPTILNHFWSLAIEEQFYVIWPIIVLKYKRNARTLISIFLTLILISVVLKLISNNIKVNYSLLPFRMDSLILGALVAIVIKEGIKIKYQILQLSLCLAFLTILFIVIFEGSTSHSTLWMSKVGYFAIDLFFAGLLLVSLQLTKLGGVFRGVLDQKVLIFFGKYSYGIYVIHWPIKHLIFKTGLLSDLRSGLLINTIILMVSVALPYVIYHLFESRFLHLKSRFEV